MVANNKVLTVSYGTFSCTLEGFDDSFGTMKAIAEYFRDLAANDRFFGAEPPQPDADLLGRIAAQEMAQSVQARADGNTVILTPGSNAETPAPQELVPTGGATDLTDESIDAPINELLQEKTDVEEGLSEESLDAEPDVEDHPAVDHLLTGDAEDTVAVADREDASTQTEDVASGIQEEGRSDAAALAANIQNTLVEDQAGFAEEVALEARSVPETDVLQTNKRDAPELDVTETSELEEVEADVQPDLPDNEDMRAVEEQPETVKTKQQQPQTEASDSDSLAAKLRRIQSVVGAGASAPRPRTEYSEDEHAEDFSEGAPDEAEAQAPTEKAQQAVEDNRPIETPETPAEVTQEKVTKEDVQEALAKSAEAADPARPRVLKMKRADFEAAMAKSGAKLKPSPESAAKAQAEEVLPAKEAQAKAAAPRIFAEAEVADAADEADLQSTLSDKDEAELMATLAAVEKEVKKSDATDLDAPTTQAKTPEAAPTPHDLARAESEADADDDRTIVYGDSHNDDDQTSRSFEDSEVSVGRLMDKADAKLGEPENKNRRDVYAHLKAAVAATQAARSMGDAPDAKDDPEGDYRKDLSDVVRPRRAPKPAEQRSKRPDPAPLKLVAAQRVDVAPQEEVEQKASAQPVRPRRVAAGTAAPAPTEAQGFAGFAQSAGAEGLPEILEAAAAYLTHADGNDVFSRPQVMRVVQQAMPQGSFTREDGLRAFGTLLRQGRLHKVRGGQFEVTDSTRYQPEARELRAAG